MSSRTLEVKTAFTSRNKRDVLHQAYQEQSRCFKDSEMTAQREQALQRAVHAALASSHDVVAFGTSQLPNEPALQSLGASLLVRAQYPRRHSSGWPARSRPRRDSLSSSICSICGSDRTP